MNTFFVTDYFWPSIGGLENSTAYLSASLGKRMPVTILTTTPAQGFRRRAPVPLKRFPISSGKAYQQIARYLEKAEAPVCACFMGFSDLMTDAHLGLLSIVKERLAGKVLFKVPSLNEFSLYANTEDRLHQLSSVDFFICPNRAIREELAVRGIPHQKLVVQPNGVPVWHFFPVSRTRKKTLLQKLGLRDQPTFIFTGRFAARKRIDILVEAFSAFGEANLLLVGYHDKRFDAGASFNLPPGDRIRVFKPVFDIRPYLGAADVFVSASEAEGMSNSLLEAMSCGLPGLVSDIPGHREVIDPGFNGRSFAPGSLEGLVSEIQWFVRRQDDLERLSKYARETILSRYRIESVADLYFRLITM